MIALISFKPLWVFRGQAVIAAAIGGLIAGLKLPLLLLLPMFVLGIRNNKDLFLLLFSVYALAIGYELEVSNLYELDLVKVLSVLIPTLLLLDAGLKSESEEETGGFTHAHELLIASGVTIAFVIGWFVSVVFVAAVFGALIYELSGDKARRGVFAALISSSLLLAALVLGQGLLNLEGGGATQAIFIAAVSTIIALMFFWRKRGRTEFKLYIRSGFIL